MLKNLVKALQEILKDENDKWSFSRLAGGFSFGVVMWHIVYMTLNHPQQGIEWTELGIFLGGSSLPYIASAWRSVQAVAK